jgi:hypothetical protein
MLRRPATARRDNHHSAAEIPLVEPRGTVESAAPMR